ncbi:hypothetical protein A2U01_0076059, partial [Trifolium medium]|nr:hypothetical protein [Trifolium medium]
MLIQSPHSSENPFDAFNPFLSTIGIIPYFEDRRFVVHEPLQPEFIFSASPSFLCFPVSSPTDSLLSHGVSHQFHRIGKCPLSHNLN